MDALRSQQNFQQLLIQLATRFINSPVSEMDEMLVEALRQVSEALGAFRASINIILEDRTRYANLYEWQSPRVPVIPVEAQPFPDKTDLFPVLEEGGAIIVPNRHDLPDGSELKRLFGLSGIAASAGVPVLREGHLFAMVTISWDEPYDITPEMVNLLRVVGEIFLNVLERREKEDQLEQRVQERTEELRQSEQQLRTILESSPIPMVVTDSQGATLYINPTAASIFGGDLHQLHDYMSAGFYVDMSQRDLLQERVNQQGFVKDYEMQYRVSDGVMRAGLVSIRPFQFTGKPAFLTSFIDVTEIKRMQQIEYEQRALSEALLSSAMVLMGTLEFNEVIDHILTSLRRVVPHDTCNLMIIEGQEMVMLGYRSYIEDGVSYQPAHTRLPLTRTYYPRQMIDTRNPVVVGDITKDPNIVHLSNPPSPIKSYLGVPIIIRQEVFGFINLSHIEPNFFTEAHIAYLQLFALQAGLALQNARHFTQARAIATLEERQRLARDLHDSVTQTLFSANSIAEMLPAILDRKPEKMREYLSELTMLTRGAMAEMRTLLVELRPEALTQTEFSILIGHLCDVFTGKTQIDVSRRINKKTLLPPDVQIVFYRVAQESLNNIAKHAQAKQVELTVHIDAGAIEMKIRDDGNGFETQGISGDHFGDHFGLKIMRERAKEISADLQIKSQIGQGTQVILRKLLS